MSSDTGSRSTRIIGALGRLIDTCRRAEFAPEALAARERYRWNQAILDGFEALLEEREDLVLLKAMLRHSARAELAAELLPGLEGLLGAEFYDQMIDLQSKHLDGQAGDGPVLLFDKTQAGAESPPRLGKKRSAPARSKAKGKRSASRRTAGDAA